MGLVGRKHLTVDHIIAPVGGSSKHKYEIYMPVKERMRDKSSGDDLSRFSTVNYPLHVHVEIDPAMPEDVASIGHGREVFVHCMSS